MHQWNLTPDEAIATQDALRGKVQRTNGFVPTEIRTVAGVDVDYSDAGRAAIVVLSFPDLAPVTQAVATVSSPFPYVPGLLSFRECPSALAAWEQLTVKPDLIICDGQGLAHPRRFGLACHMGVLLDIPSIGCAKTHFIGTYDEPGPHAGDSTPLRDGDEVIGYVLRTRADTKPLFVSIGHKIDLDTAADFVLRCTRGFRLPETTRAADHLARGH